MKTILFVFMFIHSFAHAEGNPEGSMSNPNTETLKISAALQTQECTYYSDQFSTCSSVFPIGNPEQIVLEPDGSTCNIEDGRTDVHCEPSLRGEWIKSKFVYGKRFIGIISVNKQIIRFERRPEFETYYWVNVEILEGGKTVAKMTTSFTDWSQFPPVLLEGPTLERITPTGKTTSTVTLSLGKSMELVTPGPLPKISEGASLDSNRITWNILKGRIRLSK